MVHRTLVSNSFGKFRSTLQKICKPGALTWQKLLETRLTQKVFHCAQEKRSEPAFRLISDHVGAILNQISEETLSEILRIVR